MVQWEAKCRYGGHDVGSMPKQREKTARERRDTCTWPEGSRGRRHKAVAGRRYKRETAEQWGYGQAGSKEVRWGEVAGGERSKGEQLLLHLHTNHLHWSTWCSNCSFVCICVLPYLQTEKRKSCRQRKSWLELLQYSVHRNGPITVHM